MGFLAAHSCRQNVFRWLRSALFAARAIENMTAHNLSPATQQSCLPFSLRGGWLEQAGDGA
jgi:hypothetical protein